MELSRRDFLKLSGLSTGALLFYRPFDRETASAKTLKRVPLHKKVGEKTTICPYCGVGCGAIVAVEGGEVVNIEGDPDHPINRGSLCPKGMSLSSVTNNKRRMIKVLYRAPGATAWEEKTWDWAIEQIARKIKQTRDSNWIEKDAEGKEVNRVEAIASLGSVFPNDEEAYLMTKLQRALGLVWIENEARICVSSAVAANTATFGRGPMTNSWIDLGNSDCIMVIGGNAAETFPNAFKWIMKAKEKGAKLIHVDPRFTRTSAKADIYLRIRTGTDVALVNGMIKYVLDDMERNPEKYNMEYLREYTDASFLVDPRFEFKDGLFSGYDSAKRAYDKSTWKYQLDEKGKPKMDKSLQDPQCVFQLLKKHFSRYDVDTVCKITGASKDVFLKACQTFAATGAKGRAGAVVLSSGACEYTHGTQNVRAYGILQLLLGNMGIAGGGINGVAGAVNGLGCSLQGRLFHWFPGALPTPQASQQTLDKYAKAGALRSRMVSLLKAWYGDNATSANDYGYKWLPKRGGAHSFVLLCDAMHEGKIKGLICWGMNPAVSAPHGGRVQEALGKLDWLVVIDPWETETAAFWKRPGVDSRGIKTEVFFLPAASSLEKEGSVCSSARWLQWRYKAIDPPGEAKADLWIITKLALKLKELYSKEGGPNAEAITKLTWDYGDPPDVHRVAREINGYDLKTGKLLSSLTLLKADGTTSSGNWIFCGSYTEEGNLAARRDPSPGPFNIGLYPKWAWVWPLNRRIWYNRASVDLNGNPWDPQRPVIKWDPLSKKWLGDSPDGGAPPIAYGGGYPFIMKKPHGRACLFANGLADGPLPEHYETWESPVKNLMSSQQSNPVLKLWEASPKGTVDKYPLQATTFRLVEHMHTGSFTRNLPWLVELQPEMFVEISQELAAEKGIRSGDKIVVESARGKIVAVALVTKRLRPFSVNGRLIHQVAMPWCWGYMGLSKGSSANFLTPCVADANTGIPEFRSFLCDIRKA